MKNYFLIIGLFLTSLVFSQSLGADRVAKTKKGVVRILIDDKPSGTGFIYKEDGAVLTNWHVIEPSLGLDERGNIIINKKINIEFYDKIKVEYTIVDNYLKDGQREAFAYDFCSLIPIKPLENSFGILKIGRFDDISEGDQVFTIGYPFGIEQQFVSTGILSTKWIESYQFQTGGRPDSVERNVAWIDMTMNKGNSGGPIIRMGENYSDDKVVGIATFIQSTYNTAADELFYKVFKQEVYMEIEGINQVDINRIISRAIMNNSVGISGCVSIDHFKESLK